MDYQAVRNIYIFVTRYKYKVKYLGNDRYIIQYSDGIEYYLNNKLHREDGPAIEYNNGDKYWYLNDELHREDGPAIECADGDKEWWINGKLHRDNGPAIEYNNGDKYWYLNDKLHREDGPVIECADGTMVSKWKIFN